METKYILLLLCSLMVAMSLYLRSKTKRKKDLGIATPEDGEKIDQYLIRQLNANPNKHSTIIVDECANLTKTTWLTRYQMPGIISGPGVEHTLSVHWNESIYNFKKQKGIWSKMD